MSKRLFGKVAWIWKPEQYGKPFEKMAEAPSAPPSMYFSAAPPKVVPTANLSGQVLRCLQRIFLIQSGVKGIGGWCKTDDGAYLVQMSHINGAAIQTAFNNALEYQYFPEGNGGYTQVYYNPSNGKYVAASVDEAGNRSKLSPDDSKTAFMTAALLYAIDSDDEAKSAWNNYETLQEEALNASSASEELTKSACMISDNFYRRHVYADVIEENYPGKSINANLDSVGELKEIHLAGIEPITGYGYISGIGEIAPSKERKESQKGKRPDRPSSVSELKGFYKLFPDRILSEEEEALVPTIPETYQMTEQFLEICELAKESTDLPTPIRNFLFIGGAGSGKTEAVKMLAYALGLPLLHQPCGVDTEKFDIAQQVIPDGAGGFKYVKGPMIRACEKGYVCEVSEADLILKQGTLGEFNPLLDKTGTYPLSTGELVKRHPDTVLVFTMNGDYEGCRNLNQAVRNRCMVQLFDTPSDEELIRRVRTESGFEDTETIKKMVDVYHRIREYCETNSITDGAVGVRNLIQWASTTEINGRPYHNAFSCMVLGATFDSEAHEDLMRCVETQFSPEEVILP